MTMSKPFALVLMPFTAAHPLKNGYRPLDQDDLDTIYTLIRTVLTNLGFEVRRAESPSDIMRDLVLDLDRADLVVADLTSLNPNVMYELGIRHGFSKKTIILTQDRDELPFDIAGTYTVEYGWVKDKEKADFERKIRELLALIDGKSDPRFGPVHIHLGSKELGVVDRDHELVLHRLQALSLELLHTNMAVTELRDRLKSQFPADFPADEKPIPQLDQVSEELTLAASQVNWAPRAFPAVDLLLSNVYIPADYDSFGEISQFMFHLRLLRDRSIELNQSPSLTLIEWVWRHSNALLSRTLYVSAVIRNRRKGQAIFSDNNQTLAESEGERFLAVTSQIAAVTEDQAKPVPAAIPGSEHDVKHSTPTLPGQ